ncbi:hypothetical protein [Haloterrigena sp. H1]|nr:hypothetical protein [Haloterrigena sp. H1]
MQKLTERSQNHLEQALQTDDPSEKDFHIRQVMQMCGVDDLPDESDAE